VVEVVKVILVQDDRQKGKKAARRAGTYKDKEE
jgi:hypothetical protein